MTKTLIILKKEHTIAKDIVDVLKYFRNQLEEGKSVSLLNLKEFLQAAGKFLEIHHFKEMEIFPFLSANGEVERRELLAVLSGEHQLGYEYLANIFQIIDRQHHDNEDKKELLPFHLEKYAQMLVGHIEKEEREFFPLIDNYIPKDQDEKLEKEFKKIEEKYNNRKAIGIISQTKLRCNITRRN